MQTMTKADVHTQMSYMALALMGLCMAITFNLLSESVEWKMLSSWLTVVMSFATYHYVIKTAKAACSPETK